MEAIILPLPLTYPPPPLHNPGFADVPRYLPFYTTGSGFGSALGQTISGIICSYLGWEWSFYILGNIHNDEPKYTVRVKRKKKPGLTPNLSKSEKDIAKLISVHDSVIILLSFGTLIFHIRPWMAGCINQICKTCQNCFCPSWRCLRCMMAFSGAFTTKQHFMHPHCIVNLDEDNFDMLFKKLLLSSHL